MYYWEEFTAEIHRSLKPGARVLDAGAGDGHWQAVLPNGIEYFGVDLGVGDKAVDYSHLDAKADLHHLPFRSNQFDAVVSIQVLEHMRRPWQALDELARVLRPGGLLFLSCPQGEPQHQVPYDFFRYTPFGLRALLEDRQLDVDFIIPQRGDFSKLGNDIQHAARSVGARGLLGKGLSIYMRGLWRLHAPIARRLEAWPELQTNPTGHFVKARKPASGTSRNG